MLRQDFCDYHFHWSPLFLFLSPLIICLSSRFVFWNTWSSRDRQVLQSSPSSSLILFLHVCFFGSLVLVVVVISWCCRQVQSQWCNKKDEKKEQYPHQKTRANQHLFSQHRETPIVVRVVIPWFWGRFIMVLRVLSSLGSLMIVLIVCLILVLDLLVLNDASLVFVVLLSGVLWLVLIALFFSGLLWTNSPYNSQ